MRIDEISFNSRTENISFAGLLYWKIIPTSRHLISKCNGASVLVILNLSQDHFLFPLFQVGFTEWTPVYQPFKWLDLALTNWKGRVWWMKIEKTKKHVGLKPIKSEHVEKHLFLLGVSLNVSAQERWIFTTLSSTISNKHNSSTKWNWTMQQSVETSGFTQTLDITGLQSVKHHSKLPNSPKSVQNHTQPGRHSPQTQQIKNSSTTHLGWL